MATKKNLDKLKEKIDEEKQEIFSVEYEEKSEKNAFKIGCGVAVAYFSLRYFLGPDISFDNITNFWQAADVVGLSSAGVGFLGGFAYCMDYFSEKFSQKHLKENKSKLEELSENYKSKNL